MAKITIEIPDADLWSEIFGSGFESYPWWGEVTHQRGTSWVKPGTTYLELVDPDDEDVYVAGGYIVLNDLEAATSEVLQKYPYRDVFDMDAELADMILQTAVAGRVIFG